MKSALVSRRFYSGFRNVFQTWWLAKFGLLLAGAGLFLPRGDARADCTPTPPGLVSWWRGEGNAVDVVGGNDGTVNGGTTYAAGEAGQAFNFNGVNGFVQVPDAPTLDFPSNSPMSIELWAYRTGAETTMHLLGKRVADCGALQYEIYFNPYVGLAFAGGNGLVQTGWLMPLNTWVHIAGTFDGMNTFSFYTNGVLAATGNGSLGASNNGPFTIGTSGECSYFAGLLDEISLYSICLTASEIQAIYSAGSAGKCFTPPGITTQPQSQTALLGETVTFNVVASGGTPPYSYQWRMNGADISGATSNVLVLSDVQSNQAGSYSVVVGGVGGEVVSSNAVLAVVTPVPGEVVVMSQAGLLAGLAAGGTVTFGSNGTIVLSQTVVISQDTVLDGSGHNVTISGSRAVQVLSVKSGVHFSLKNLTIADGLSIGSNGSGEVAGGFYNGGGTVSIVQCVFAGNAAVGGAGASVYGGAIYNDLGTLNITNSSFLSNNATGAAAGGEIATGGNSYGGAIYNNGGTLNLAGSTFLSNSSVGGFGGIVLSGSAFGGAVHNSGGTLNVMESTFTGNSSSSGSIVSAIMNLPGAEGSSFGGALSILAGNVTVINSSFFSNNAASPSIDAYPEGGTAGPAFGGGIYQASGTLNLVDTVLATNSAMGGSSLTYAQPANGYGGGIFNAGMLNSTNCAFYENDALAGACADGSRTIADAYGGAIFNQGTANLVDATLSGNLALGEYGGYIMADIPGNSGTGNGGGIFNSNVLLLLGCTLSQNSAVGQAVASEMGGGGIPGNGFGGGIYNLGICLATNDTLVGNSATGGSTAAPYAGGSANGGGFFSQGGTVTFAYLTICGNRAIGGAGSPNGLGVGGGINATNGSLLLLDSIVAENPAGSDFYGTYGALTDGGDNISSDSSFPFSAAGSMNNTNPQLGQLGNYGGPTQTVPLLAGSPAIDAGGAGGCPATDQRGVARPVGGACDIGAFEFGPYVASFTIQGQVRSFGLTGIITVSAGVQSSTTDNDGNYVLNGVDAGTHSVTPLSSIPGIIFIPTSQTISVGPSATNVNFAAYLLNSLNMDSYSNGVLQFAFGGTNGQAEVVEVSTNLINWEPVATYVLGSDGLLPFALTNNAAQPMQFIRTRTP